MKTENFSDRLNKLMNDRKLKQSDVVKKCKPYCDKYGVKIGGSSINQYVNGQFEPTQDKLAVISMALDVNLMWLMGYDVPMVKENSMKSIDKEHEVLEKFCRLNDRDKKITINLIDSMLSN